MEKKKSPTTLKSEMRSHKIGKDVPKNELGGQNSSKAKMSNHEHLARQDRRGANKAAATKKWK